MDDFETFFFNFLQVFLELTACFLKIVRRGSRLANSGVKSNPTLSSLWECMIRILKGNSHVGGPRKKWKKTVKGVCSHLYALTKGHNIVINLRTERIQF